MTSSRETQEKSVVGGGKLAFVVCPRCGEEFEWPRNLETSIAVLLYREGKLPFGRIIGRLGGTKSGTVWALRQLRDKWHLTSKRRDEDGKMYHFLRKKGKREVRAFLRSTKPD